VTIQEKSAKEGMKVRMLVARTIGRGPPKKASDLRFDWYAPWDLNPEPAD